MKSVLATLLVSVHAVLPRPAAAIEQDSAPKPAIVLNVAGDVPRKLTLTAADFARLPRQTLRAKDQAR
jgi:hypothetical protein